MSEQKNPWDISCFHCVQLLQVLARMDKLKQTSPVCFANTPDVKEKDPKTRGILKGLILGLHTRITLLTGVFTQHTSTASKSHQGFTAKVGAPTAECREALCPGILPMNTKWDFCEFGYPMTLQNFNKSPKLERCDSFTVPYQHEARLTGPCPATRASSDVQHHCTPWSVLGWDTAHGGWLKEKICMGQEFIVCHEPGQRDKPN